MIDFLISPPLQPPFTAIAELYWLPAGHFLFRRRDEGQVISKFVTLADVSAAFTGVETDTGWLPPGVVRVGFCKHGHFAVYAAPAQTITLSLVGNGEEAAIIAPIPATVMLGVGRSYYITALLAGEFLPGAAACHAPFPNVHPDGEICWGGNHPPEAEPESLPKAWALFMQSPFNDHLMEGKSRKFSLDVRIQLRTLAQKKARRYPAKDLIERRKTVSAWLDGILGTGGRL